MSGSAADPVADTLRSLDRERYYATLILPQDKRGPVQALYAAIAEIASVGERINEPMAGEIRLTWWSDLIGGQVHGEAQQNPVAAALVDTIARHRLPTEPLKNLIAARRFDLYADPMPDITTFEGYAGETVSVPLQLAATVLNDGTPPESGEVAGHLGVALAFAGHLRAFGFNAVRGRVFLPLSIFREEGVGEREIMARTDSPALRKGLERCRALGHDHFSKARAGLGDLPRTIRPAFAQIAMIDTQGPRGNDPFAPPKRRARLADPVEAHVVCRAPDITGRASWTFNGCPTGSRPISNASLRGFPWRRSIPVRPPSLFSSSPTSSCRWTRRRACGLSPALVSASSSPWPGACSLKAAPSAAEQA